MLRCFFSIEHLYIDIHKKLNKNCVQNFCSSKIDKNVFDPFILFILSYASDYTFESVHG